MRKEDKDRNDKGRVKFRFVEFELEGDNPTLQDALRNITAAMTSRSGTGNVVVSSIKEPTAFLAAPSPNGIADESTVDTVVTKEADSVPSSPKAPRHGGQPRSPQVLDLDMTSGKIPLKAFCEAKNPTTEHQKYLVIAAWLKENRSIAEVTMDHIHTGYRHMGWHTPSDASAALRQMKQSKYGYFRKGTGKGAYTLIHTGENVVSQMGKGKGK